VGIKEKRSNDFFIRGTYNISNAEVAELADALGSGSSGRKAVRVQIPPSAPKISSNISTINEDLMKDAEYT
jgi:hypothetical protein